MADKKLNAQANCGADLIPLSALLSLPSGFYNGRWIDCDSMAALVEDCVRMAPPQAQPAPVQAEPVADEQIKAVFLANGFTIKEGLTDLKPYVYQAARALLQLAAPQAQPADALDAARYRWLRDISVPPHNFYLSVPDEFGGVKYAPVEVDAAIDAAIAAMAAAQEGGNASAGKDGAA